MAKFSPRVVRTERSSFGVQRDMVENVCSCKLTITSDQTRAVFPERRRSECKERSAVAQDVNDSIGPVSKANWTEY